MYRELDNKFESPDNVLVIKARTCTLEQLWHVVGLAMQGQYGGYWEAKQEMGEKTDDQY